MLTAEILTKMEKVERLTVSPNEGEAAAARIKLSEMRAKYLNLSPMQKAMEWLEARDFGIMQSGDGSLYVTPIDNVGTILFDGLQPSDLPTAVQLMMEDSYVLP